MTTISLKSLTNGIVISIATLIALQIRAQVDNDTTRFYYPTNEDIDHAFALTDELKYQAIDFKTPEKPEDENTDGATWYYLKSIDELPAIDVKCEDGLLEIKVYGPFSDDYLAAKTVITNGGSQPFIEYEKLPNELLETFRIDDITQEGLYIIKVSPVMSQALIEFEPQAELARVTNSKDVLGAPKECVDCIDGEMPETGLYLLSAWVSMANQPAGTTSYSGPSITVQTTAGSTIISPDPDNYIIDNWQLLEGYFSMPAGNAVFNITLNCTGSGACYYDDIRFLPKESSMKTYVYDPNTLRLSAELDERHFATLYEYDEDGQLKRIKKETERGVMTIQESTSKTSQNP